MTKRLMAHVIDDQYKELKAYTLQLIYALKDTVEYHDIIGDIDTVPGTVCVTLLHTRLGQLDIGECGPSELSEYFEGIVTRAIPGLPEGVRVALDQLCAAIDHMAGTEYLPIDINDLGELCELDMSDIGKLETQFKSLHPGVRISRWLVTFNKATDIIVVEPLYETVDYSIH